MIRASKLSQLLVSLSILAAPLGSARAEDYFDVSEMASTGRAVAAELADVDGDGRTDLFVVGLTGIPPEEERRIRVYLQGEDGKLPAKPSHVIPLPEWSAVYDLADVRPDSPGAEMLLLRPQGVTLLSLASAEPQRFDLKTPGPTGVGLSDDERGFEKFQIVYDGFGDEPRLVVPQLGQVSVLTPTGEVEAQLAVPRRANYLIIPSGGFLSVESDFQIFVDVPKIALGDVNGDGRIDVISSTRHEVLVFLRKEDGSFDRDPSKRLPLRLVTPEDHIRGSGGVVTESADINGDGRADLVVSHTQGSFRDATSTVYLYMNRNGGWNLDQPDQVLGPEQNVSSNSLIDIDRDGRHEMLRAKIVFTLFEFIELLVSQEIDGTLAVYSYEEGVGFGDEPRLERKFSVPFSFDTFRPNGFVPSARVDINADGYKDFVASGGGEMVEVYRGTAEGPFAERVAEQPLDTAGVIRFGDLDSDGLDDFVIFDPYHFDVPIRLGRNLGNIPGTPPRLTSPED